MLIFLTACLDYDFSPSKDVTGTPTDTSEVECPPQIPDCNDTEEPVDDSAVVVDPIYCDDLYFAGEDLETVDECVNEPVIGTWTPIIEWENTDPGGVYTTPVVGNLTDDNGDGKIDDSDVPDVVVGNTSGTYYAMSGDTGVTLWSSSVSLGSEPMTAAIGDVDGDGRPDVVGSGVNGIAAWDGETGTQIWKVGAFSGGNTPQCGAVGVHDLGGDGDVEVVIGHSIYEGATGSLKAKGSYGSGAGHAWAAPMGVAADIDQDGELEVVVGNAIYDENGTAEWYNGESDGFVAVGQFDSDPEGEIVVARVGNLRLQDDDGTVLWRKNGITGSTIGPPTVADFDGDGDPEIGVAGNGVYIVVDKDGNTLWQNNVQDFSSGFTGSSVFDFEGDGAAEVVYADEVYVWVFDGATGAVKLQEGTHSSATCSEYPAVADVDNDGHAEIVYSSSPYGSPAFSGVRVIGDADDSWQRARPVWNQHAYYITNVDIDSSIPASPDTNWLDYNNFRSGDVLAGQGGSLPDLVVTLDYVCETECDRGRIFVWGRVGNQGAIDTDDPVELVLYAMTPDGEKRLTSKVITQPLTSGKLDGSIEFEVAGLDGWTIYDLYLKVDGGNNDPGNIVECNEDNNETSWGGAVCQLQ